MTLHWTCCQWDPPLQFILCVPSWVCVTSIIHGNCLISRIFIIKVNSFLWLSFWCCLLRSRFCLLCKKKRAFKYMYIVNVLQGLSLFWPYDLCYHGLSLVHFPIIIFGKYFSVILIYMYILLHLYTCTCIFSSIFTFIFVWTQNSVICLNDTNLFKGEGNLQFCWKINIS